MCQQGFSRKTEVLLIGMATPSSIPTWKIPWTEEPDTLQSMGSQRFGHNWAANVNIWASQMMLVVKNLPAKARDTGLIPGSGRSPGEGNGNPLHYSCWTIPWTGGAWCVAVHGVTKSLTQLSTRICISIYFEELAYAVMMAAKSKICRTGWWTGNSWEGANAAVLKNNFFFREACFVLKAFQPIRCVPPLLEKVISFT